MGLLEQEIHELRQLHAAFKSGQVSADNVATELTIYSQTEKRAKLILQAHALSAKFGRKMAYRITQSNLIGKGVVIDVGQENAEGELITCPDQEGKKIARVDCLDYSGDRDHIDACGTCEQFNITRNLLLKDGEDNGARA